MFCLSKFKVAHCSVVAAGLVQVYPPSHYRPPTKSYSRCRQCNSSLIKIMIIDVVVVVISQDSDSQQIRVLNISLFIEMHCLDSAQVLYYEPVYQIKKSRASTSDSPLLSISYNATA